MQNFLRRSRRQGGWTDATPPLMFHVPEALVVIASGKVTDLLLCTILLLLTLPVHTPKERPPCIVGGQMAGRWTHAVPLIGSRSWSRLRGGKRVMTISSHDAIPPHDMTSPP